jgi:uncharacterized protein
MIPIDTGVFLALLNRRDPYHQEVQLALSRVRERLITTYPVLTETCYFLLARQCDVSPAHFLQQITQQGLVTLFDFEIHHLKRMAELMERYGDQPMDFADASLVVLAEQLGHGRILTIDRRDFAVYRWNNHQPFENLV